MKANSDFSDFFSISVLFVNWFLLYIERFPVEFADLFTS